MNKRLLIFIIPFILILIGIFNTTKPLPEGIDYKSENYNVQNITFLYDLTYNKNTEHDQEIFDTILTQIDKAENYILIDMFLFNSNMGNANSTFRKLSSELTNKLISKKINQPDIKIDFITDEINTVYGGSKSREIELLKEHDINIIITNLKPLRDSNPVYSTLWRTFIQWFGNSEDGGIIQHPFSKDDKVSIRSYLRLLNFKANHRKVFVADTTSIISSANPHDGSSAHSNVAFMITGDLWKGIYETESNIVSMSDSYLQNISRESITGNQKAQILTEKQIKRELLEQLDSTEEGDKISIAMFYLSDRNIVKSILKASKRGVDIRIILDPNKDAFGYEKNGIPNRQVASELVKKSKNKIKIRWYDTAGEQFHAKMIVIEKKNGEVIIILGSANLTRRNIDNYNLELNVKVTTDITSDINKDITRYFNMIWYNDNNNTYTVDYSQYQDDSMIKKLIYRFQEFTGFCTF